MDPVRNPFVPGAGTQPPQLTGREGLLEQGRIALERVRRGRPAKSFIAVGLRGVGKTVLLNRLRQTAEEVGYRSLMIEASEQKPLPVLLVPYLRSLLLELDRLGALNAQVKQALRALKGFVSAFKLKYAEMELALDVEPDKGLADSGDIESDLPDLMLAVARAAAGRETAVALLVDEIQYIAERDMSALIVSLHKVAQANLPLLMIAAGLPQVVGLSGRAKSYAERLFDFPSIQPLDPVDAARAIAAPVQQEGAAIDPDAVDEIVRQTDGYPYFLQEWGYHTWNAAPASPITRQDVDHAQIRAMQALDASFFRVRFDRLTGREKDYLRAMAELPQVPLRSGDVADLLGIKVQAAGPLRAGLIDKGMVYSPAHGEIAFTVPLFGGFMRRTMPGWQPPRRP